MVEGLGSLLAAMVVVAAAPIVVAFLPGRVPQVVLLIAGGIVIGPEMLDLAQPDDITLFANLGLGFLFLLAGYELDPALLRERAGKLAIVAWVISIVLAIATVGALEAAGLVKAFVPVAIGLTTTALGTLLPILRDHHMLERRFGRSLFAAGAVGEMGPVLCIALLLGHYSSIVEVIGVAAVAGVVFALS
ncbi:MAG TPA: cation:proton antiporter, partial [Actinomycetota bacterium]|nr:cation:proton antiporter [Actinomycetota bacterium]